MNPGSCCGVVRPIVVVCCQAKQVNCPIAGRPVNSEKTVKMAGVEVGFCCGNCQKKAGSAEGDEQLAIAFSDAAFKKGFEIKKKK